MSYSQQKHIINKLQVDVETQNPGTAFDLKDQLDTFLKNEIFPYLENYFSSLEEDLQDQIIQIPYVEVDVKTSSVLNYQELKEDVKRALVKNIENLTKQAHPNNEKATLLTTAQSTEQEFIHFLEKGTLPWWSRGENSFEMNEEEFDRMISSKNFASRMRKKLMKAAVKKRIIQQLSNEQLNRVWEQLSTENSTMSISNTALTLLDSVSSQMRQIVWNCLLDFSFQNDVETLVSRLLFSLTEEVSMSKVSLTSKSKNEVNNKNRLASQLILNLLAETSESTRVSKALEILQKSQLSKKSENAQSDKTSTKTSHENTGNIAQGTEKSTTSLTEDVQNRLKKDTSENLIRESLTNDSIQEVTAKNSEKGEVSKNQYNDPKSSLEGSKDLEKEETAQKEDQDQSSSKSKQTASKHDPKANAEGSKSTTEETHHDPKATAEGSKATTEGSKKVQETLANSVESKEPNPLSEAEQLKEQKTVNSKVSKGSEKEETAQKEDEDQLPSKSKQTASNHDPKSSLEGSKNLIEGTHNDPKATAEGSKAIAEGSREADQNNHEISKMSANYSDENPEEEVVITARELKASLTELLDEQDQKLFKDLHRRQLQASQKKEERGEFQVSNAGLIMLHPYFKPFFQNCGLLNDGNTLNNPDLAVHLLHYLATKQEQQFESNMLFEKMLCGVHSETPIRRNLVLSEVMKSDAEDLLTSVLQNWGVLKNASPDLLRGEFLTRFGRISFKENNPKLIVERKVQDVLLDKLPWGIGICRLPWLDYLLFTDW